jgi:hypothetical protein
MNSRAKRSAIASAIVGAIVMVICIVGLLHDVQLPSQDVVSWRNNWKHTYVERWQEEVLYGIVLCLPAVFSQQALADCESCEPV